MIPCRDAPAALFAGMKKAPRGMARGLFSSYPEKDHLLDCHAVDYYRTAADSQSSLDGGHPADGDKIGIIASLQGYGCTFVEEDILAEGEYPCLDGVACLGGVVGNLEGRESCRRFFDSGGLYIGEGGVDRGVGVHGRGAGAGPAAASRPAGKGVISRWGGGQSD